MALSNTADVIPYTRIITAYEQLLSQTANQYGQRSQALVFLKYEYLISLRDIIARDALGAAALREKVADLSCQIQQHYWDGDVVPTPAPPSRLLATNPPLIEFDRKYYDQYYRLTGEAIQEHLLVVDHSIMQHVRPMAAYIYVVDESYQLIIYLREFDLQDLIFGRNRVRIANGPITHPMLVHDTLRVRAAGEIVFIGQDRAASLIANTKSGHFRPPLSSANVVRYLCCNLLKLADDDVHVFSLFR